MTTFQIVGIDPSLSDTGLARIRIGEDGAVLSTWVGNVKSAAIPNAQYPETLGRIRKLCAGIIRAAKEDLVEGDVLVVVMEGPIFGQSTGMYHTRAGLWWMLYHLLEKLGFLVIVEPTKLKKYLTGSGAAKKDKVFSTVIRTYPGTLVLDNNQADALGLAAMAARELGSPLESSVQKVTPAALEGVAWPAFMKQRRNAL